MSYGSSPGYDPPSTQGAGSLIAESGITEYHPDGTSTCMVGHVHPWGWT